MKNNTGTPPETQELAALRREVAYLRRRSERMLGYMLHLDTRLIATRQELEQKRRGFHLIAELYATRSEHTDYDALFVSASRRLNAVLGMQRTAVLTRDDDGLFQAVVLQGYPEEEKKRIAACRLMLDEDFLSPRKPVRITGADPESRFAETRAALGLPFLIASPVYVYDDVAALLVTGRMVEQAPWLPRLTPVDTETVQAVSAYLAALLTSRRLAEAVEKKQTELRLALDRAEDSARAKSRFLSNISHEIRTPMNAVVGMTQLLADADLNEAQRTLVGNAKRSSDQLMRIVNDLLDFSALENERLDLASERVSIPALLRAVESEEKPAALAKGLHFAVSAAPELPEWILGDAARLKQALHNLTGNAVKFTHQGSVSVHASLATGGAAFPSGGPALLFTVSDTGIGMDAEELESLFSPFTQADGSATREYGGTGIGLALSKKLVEMMGGSLWCESRPGRGSVFFFSVPLVNAERAEQAEQAGQDIPNDGDDAGDMDTFDDLQGMHVLLVEDNEINRMIAGEILAAKGVIVDTADNGLEALERLEQSSYDLVLMDIQMPKMDGIETTVRIRANPRFKTLPVIALTAHARPEDRETSLNSGMNEHLTKPIDAGELYAAISHWRRGKTNTGGIISRIQRQGLCAANPGSANG